MPIVDGEGGGNGTFRCGCMQIVDITGVITVYLGVGVYQLYKIKRNNNGFGFGCLQIVDIKVVIIVYLGVGVYLLHKIKETTVHLDLGA